MKNISLIIFSIFITFSTVFTQTVNQTDAKGLKQGMWQKKYPNSNVFEYKGEFKNNIPFGTFFYYYPTGGKKAVVVHLTNGRSVANYFYESGELMSKGIFRNQKKDSIWSNYTERSFLSSKESYKNGILDGVKTIYFPGEVGGDGLPVISATISYKNGKLDGDHIEYFRHAPTIIKSKTTYVNDVKNGLVITYHPNGKVMTEERYKNGVKHGYSFGYDENGKETGRRYFKNGIELSGKDLNLWLKQCKERGINPNN